MAKSKLGTGKIILISLLTCIVCSAIATLVFDPFNKIDNKEEDKVVDESRVAVTFLGSYGSKQTSVYAFFEHPDLAESQALWDWAGIAPRSLIGSEGYDYISSNGGNLYTVEFTELLPLGYTSFEDYLNDDGALTVIISYAGENSDSRIQTQNITLNESGNHILGLPSASYESVSHEVEKFYKVIDEEDSSANEEDNISEVEEKYVDYTDTVEYLNGYSSDDAYVNIYKENNTLNVIISGNFEIDQTSFNVSSVQTLLRFTLDEETSRKLYSGSSNTAAGNVCKIAAVYYNDITYTTSLCVGFLRRESDNGNTYLVRFGNNELTADSQLTSYDYRLSLTL